MSKSGAVYYKNRKLRKENASLVRAGRKIVAERDALEMAYNEAADHADYLDGQVKHITEKFEEQGAEITRLVKALNTSLTFKEDQTTRAFAEAEAKNTALSQELRKTQRRASYYSAAFWVLCTVTAIITTIK